MQDGNSFTASREAVLAQCRPLEAEEVSFSEAQGRVLARPFSAPADDPPAPKSAMDGFALLASDTVGAAPGNPGRFTFREIVGAGHLAQGLDAPGQAVRLMTGALLPEGADAVVKLEDTQAAEKIAGENTGKNTGENAFALLAPLKSGENVIPAGARFKRGEVILEAGEVISAEAVGLLAGFNQGSVGVVRRPRVALLAVGDELVEPGTPLRAGQIHVSNLYALEAKVRRYGGEPLNLGIAPDDPGSILAALEPCLKGHGKNAPCQIALTLGGSHGGDFDFARAVFENLAAQVHFHRTRLSLGASTIFATLGQSLLFGLPGTPQPSLGAFELLVRPALWRLAGRRCIDHPRLIARLTGAVSALPSRANFIPCWLEFPPSATPEATPLRGNARVGDLSASPHAALANALIEMPDDVDRLEAGETATVMWFGE